MFNYDQFGSAFFDMRLHKLRVLITEQCDALFLQRGIRASSICISVMLFLREQRHASIAKIADSLAYSHQLIAYRLKQLENLGLVVKFADTEDRRKSLIKLSPEGEREADEIKALIPKISEIYDEIFAQIGFDLSQAIDEVRGELAMKSMSERLGEPFDTEVA